VVKSQRVGWILAFYLADIWESPNFWASAGSEFDENNTTTYNRMLDYERLESCRPPAEDGGIKNIGELVGC